MKKRFLGIFLAVLAAASVTATALTACGSSTDDTASSESTQQDEVQINEEVKNITSAKLVDTIAGQENTKNTIISKTSLDYALALLAEGADGATAQELDSYFGEGYSDRLSKMIDDYSSKKDATVKISNGVWTNKESRLLNEYTKSVKKLYGAEAETLDFSAPESLDKINGWVSENTEGLIPVILDNPKDFENMNNLLVNTLYFNADWMNPFDANETSKADFTNADGSKTEVDMMHSTEYEYLENDKATGFMKDYTDDLVFIGVLPKEEGDFTLESLDIEGLMASAENEPVNISLPKMDIGDRNELNTALMNNGMSLIFDVTNADFGRMSDTQLYVDTILQKTRIKVDEKGTEAAAATAVVMKAASIMQDPKEVNLNRPFAFAIYDKTNDEYLFMGKVVTLQN